MPTPAPRVRGRKSRFPGKSVQLSIVLPVALHAALQRHAAVLTDRDQYPCTIGDAVCDCIHTATKTKRPEGTINR